MLVVSAALHSEQSVRTRRERKVLRQLARREQIVLEDYCSHASTRVSAELDELLPVDMDHRVWTDSPLSIDALDTNLRGVLERRRHRRTLV